MAETVDMRPQLWTLGFLPEAVTEKDYYDALYREHVLDHDMTAEQKQHVKREHDIAKTRLTQTMIRLFASASRHSPGLDAHSEQQHCPFEDPQNLLAVFQEFLPDGSNGTAFVFLLWDDVPSPRVVIDSTACSFQVYGRDVVPKLGRAFLPDFLPTEIKAQLVRDYDRFRQSKEFRLYIEDDNGRRQVPLTESDDTQTKRTKRNTRWTSSVYQHHHEGREIAR